MKLSNTDTIDWQYAPGLFAVAHVIYNPECRGHGAHPDESAWCELLEVTVGGQSIHALLCDDDIATIEALALEQLGAAAQAAEDDWRIERYIDRCNQDAC